MLLATGCSKETQECAADEANKIVTHSAKEITIEEPTVKSVAEPSTKECMPTRIKLPSGLEYQILKLGDETSKTPRIGAIVSVHYTGWLADAQGNPCLDQQFDSSVKRGRPFNFHIGIGQVIKGWDEGVMSMHIGEKRRLIVPSKLGYGAHGAGELIPPNATLVFDVELLDIK